MNIRFEESSAYFSFDEKTNQCFQSFKKNISCLRMFGNDVHLFRAAFTISVMSCTIAFNLDRFPSLMFLFLYIYIQYFLFLKVAIDKNGKEISSKPGVYPPFGFSFPALGNFLDRRGGGLACHGEPFDMLLWRHES